MWGTVVQGIFDVLPEHLWLAGGPSHIKHGMAEENNNYSDGWQTRTPLQILE
jgi:hypothetical protein